MRFTLFPLLALIAIPVIAEDLDKPITVVIATNWNNGFVDGVYINGLQLDTKIDVDIIDTPGIEKKNLYKVKTFELSHINQRHEFMMERDRWVRDYFQCTVTLVEDPGIPTVHVLLMGNNDTMLDDGDYKVNLPGDSVTMKCDKKNWDEENKKGD